VRTDKIEDSSVTISFQGTLEESKALLEKFSSKNFLLTQQ